MKRTIHSGLIMAAAFYLAVTSISRADNPAPKYTVQEIMKGAFKGSDSLSKKVSQGKASKEDYDKLVDYVTALPLNDAPQGDPAGWKKKTTALLDAAIALRDGKPDALAQYNAAVNCQACHSVYRPE